MDFIVLILTLSKLHPDITDGPTLNGEKLQF